jgi:hypothetical protein
MYAMQHCSRKELWADFSCHTDAEMLEALATAQANRTGPTQWVKIKAHTSVEINERADRLATNAWKDPPIAQVTQVSFQAQEDPDLMQFYKTGAQSDEVATWKEISNHILQLRAKLVLQNQTKIARKLTAPGTGRQLLSAILWQTGQYTVSEKITKRMLQCLTNTFPTQSKLQQWGKTSEAKCPFCPATVETLFHWQQECPQFHDARSKAHNTIWEAVFDAIRTNLCEDYDWYKETTIGDTPLQAPQALKNLRPDGIFVNTINRQWTLVDYTRGSGWDRAALQQSETRKQNHYAQLVTELRKHHASVELFPLASTYNGAIAEETWRALMTRLELAPKTQTPVLHIAI